MNIYNLFALCGGLAFFLFGMNVMSNYLEKMAGGRLESILKKMTSSKWKSLVLGAVVTIAIQSSSALTVMLVGLVNSGIMEIEQTVCVIMGSDFGTTLTAWILSLSGIRSDNFFISMLKPENFSPIVALIGVFMIMGGKSQKKKDIGTILCGFAVLMYGMTIMSNAVSPLAEMPQFQKILVAFDNPIIGVLIGTAFTGIIQSSAASIGVLQALSLTGSISIGMAIPLVMGANIGTCVTAILSGIGVSRKAKRVPAIHIGIKIIGTVVWLVLYFVLRYLIRMPFFESTISSLGVAVFHSVFNVGTILFLLPFSGKLVVMAEKLVPLREEDAQSPQVLLDERLLLSPGLAVRQCREKTREMASLARDSFHQAMALFEEYSKESAERISAMEERLDYLEDELDTFLIRLSSRELADDDNNAVSEMLHSINDFERIGDHAINMTKLAQEMHTKKLKFSAEAEAELVVLRNALEEILIMTVDSFARDDDTEADKVEPLEEVIDDLTKEIKNHHVDRLQAGICRPELGILLTDYLTNCERVSDHCSNVAVCIIQTRNSSFETHSYLNELKNGNEPEFVDEFESFREKYQLPAYVPPKKKKKKGVDKDSVKGDRKKKKSSEKSVIPAAEAVGRKEKAALKKQGVL
ncbi:MAG: Na/Pi cotransporter family protein [Eubacterium sp.]|jgi:phosphate:Na+ symporter|nr:Na/Pi cotransporter family protein [Eubacterium sp.]